MRKSDGIWLRVVDVKEALERRTYGADGILTFELVDPLLERNNGVWTLTVTEGHGVASRAAQPPDVTLEAGDLGAAYLGGTSFNQLHRAGRLIAHAPESVAIADSMFHSDRAPWNPEIF